jgi:hypothetical protein
MQLNVAKPHRWPAYLDVKTGQVSRPDFTVNRGKFTDDAGRFADDSVIPEFIDQFPDAMPILYIRANAGGTAVCGAGGRSSFAGSILVDQNGQTVTPQYDLAGVIGYTHTLFGTNASKQNLSSHALQDVGVWTDTIPDTHSLAAINANDGLAYFKDPANPGTSNEQGGNARQKNGYILISPGPDRIYGTADDIIYPGSLQP